MAEGGHELIIIKRYEEEEHEHHSSAWKVAHADFMTAMMAFFLIMWLINVTDKDVRKAIANYFNPVNLSDSVSERKGLNDPEDIKDNGTSADGESMSTLKNTVGEGTGAGDDVQQGKAERTLFQDPYAVLAQIASEAPPNTPTSPDAAIGDIAPTGAGSGEQHRDPFDPVYWQMNSAPKARKIANANGMSEQQGTKPDASGPPSGEAADPAEAIADPQVGPDEAATMGGATALTSPAQETSTPGLAPKASGPKPDATGAQPAGASKVDTLGTLEQQVRADITEAMGQAVGPQVEVRRTRDGVVISLTDDIDFSMFPVGSAVPDAKLVNAMAKIAKTISARSGEVVIRGHTDGRPFRSSNYDNWQLSSARANIAHYMLVRGGLDEKRIGKIEGFADRSLKNKADPNAPENRRIEIVLREPTP
ncbi:MotB family protein [Ancylobacter radicis]|uniref:MotB family protein n=1 Tax=Ancylobacter radicis TaxID=2836179 RepID=A0ABS5REF6_9HYPH|nr:MotB family protein [Ancylobacter radicis]MBS9479326.1 MotB family protein [Ancylobacter radicis]